MISIFTTVLFLLIAGHFAADYPFQSEAVALGKNKFIDPARFGVPWTYWMAGHAFTHGILVAIFTQNVYMGLGEVVSHFITDHMKCAGKIGIHVDQAIHITFKVIWAIIYVYLEKHNVAM
jgi:hypothetical protein